MERPLFLPLLSTIIGLATADLFLRFVPDFFPYILLAAGFIFLFVKNRLPFLLILSLFFFSWGNLSLKPYLMHESPPNDVARFASNQKYTIEGVVYDRPVNAEKGSRIYLRAERISLEKGYAAVTGRMLLYVGDGSTEFRTGDRIRFISRISDPRNYGIPGEFDYVRFLAYRGVRSTAYVASGGDAVLMRRNADYHVLSFIDGIADKVGRYLSANAPGEEGFILRALLLGDTGNISEVTKEAFTRSGVNHILSISGFHVSVVSLFVFYLLFIAAKRSVFLMLHANVRRLAIVSTLPLIFFYLFLSGAAPATVRSVIMITAYIVALLLDREVDPINSLMLAAFVIIVCSPPALFDVSFQLSFLALWGIIVLTPLLIAPFQSLEGTIRHKLLVFMMVSVSATMATLPVVAYHFHRVTLTGIVANLFIVPLMGYGAVLIGFSALPFIFCFPDLAGLLVKTAAFLVKISDVIIFRLASLPTVDFYNPGRFDILTLLVLLTFATFVLRRKHKLVLCGGVAALFVVVKFVTIVNEPNSDTLRITFFSVGQGESTLVRYPNGKTMLIDGGGSLREGGMDVGERLLAPALRQMGVNDIDYVVLSHAHPDHLKGLRFIVENFTVGEFWESGIPVDSNEYREVKRIVSEKHIPVRLINASTNPVRIGDGAIEPLSPEIGNATSVIDTDRDENESSMVFRLKYGDFAMLFTGDIGFETERKLLRHPELLACTVLKTPHHGSRNSSSDAFVRAISPKVALISAGYGNSFGLPSGRTLALLRNRCIKIYRTDMDGTIEVIQGRDGYKIASFREDGHFH
jgi:competence protein ComEC